MESHAQYINCGELAGISQFLLRDGLDIIQGVLSNSIVPHLFLLGVIPLPLLFITLIGVSIINIFSIFYFVSIIKPREEKHETGLVVGAWWLGHSQPGFICCLMRIHLVLGKSPNARDKTLPWHCWAPSPPCGSVLALLHFAFYPVVCALGLIQLPEAVGTQSQ